ncbi:MAG: hypothetical protein ACREDZ_04860 [Kiloniellales bacterium]
MTALGSGLAWLGRHGTWVLFGGVFLGLALPSLAGLARPLLAPTVAVLLLTALLRLDWRGLAATARRADLTLLLVAWLLVASPLLLWLPLQLVALPSGLETALVLMAAAPPILGAVAIALLLGLDGALAVVAGLAATLIAPLVLPPLALGLLGVELTLGVFDLMLRLGALVAVAFLGAALVRRLATPALLAAKGRELDGAIVLTMLIFAIAIMDGVTAAAIADPGKVALWVAAAFLANPALQLLGALAFGWLGKRRALTVGLITGNCNMGLLLAALPPGEDLDVALYFAVAQLPMYMLPALLLPLYRRILAPQ